MPAKTVQDLIDFNSQVPDHLKVGVKIGYTSKILVASYCLLSNGEEIDQNHNARAEYYNIRKQSSDDPLVRDFDPESLAGVTRRLEPKSDKPLFPWGNASCKKNPYGDIYRCHNAYVISVTEAAKGYGPMLYDCLLAKLGEFDFGLIADRRLVSPLAAKVWTVYLNSRPDVEKKPLDYNQSTETKEDDCYEDHSEDLEWNKWYNDPTTKKAIDHAYFDNGIKTLDELKKAKLIFGNSDFVINEYLSTLYGSLMLDIINR